MSHQLLTIRLSRQDATPWGFRLQGGKDFAQPLLIQKVNGGSLSEKAGLQVGDALIKVNNLDVYSLKHKEAQDALVKAGNDFTLTVERGPGATWKPQVQAVGTASPGGIHPVTKTSLAHNKPPASPIGSGHNLSPRPFANSPQQGGDSVKAIVNKQYNTPVNIYSEESIAETLSAQAEVLAGGVLGVNFKKNERSYNAGQSEVFKMVHEVDKEPREAEPDTGINSVGLRHVAPPEPMRPPPSAPQQLPPGQNICADCERLIVGVFVRIKDKNLHVECFKCATCGTSLKNVGYYNINNKLYCDVHAKLAARQNPPAPNLVPVTVPPGGKIPSSVFTPNLPSNMTNASPASPQPGTIAPLPFHTPRLGTSHVSAPKFRPQGGPKPFGGNIGSVPPPAAPYSAPPAAPYSAPAPAPAPVPAPAAPAPTSFSTPSQQPQGYYTPTRPMSNIRAVLWPPQSISHATLSQPTSVDKRMSICSQEVSCISEQSKLQAGYTSITEITEDRPASPIPFKREPLNPKLIRTVKQTALRHSSEKLETKPKRVNSEPSRKSPDPKSDSHRPHEIKSLLVDASIVRSLSPVQVVVFPPELPPMLPMRPRSATPKKCEPESPAKIPISKRSRSPKGKKIKEGNICTKVEASVNVKKQVDKIESVHYNQQVEKKATSIRDLPKPTMQSGAMASALATASDKPFRPNIIKERALVPTGKVGLPPETVPYFPPEHGDKDEKVAQALREVRCKSPMTDMLTTASSRPYSPLPSVTQISSVSSTSSMATSSVKNVSSMTTSSVTNVGFHPIRKPVSMISALTVAPKIPFTVPGKTPVPSESLPVPSAFKPVSPTSPTFVPVPGRPHSPMKYYPAYTKIPQPSPPPVITRGEFTDKEHIQYDTTIKPHSPKPVTRTTVKESTKTTGKTDTLKTKQVTQLSQSETYLLPYYQQNIGEIPIRRSISPIRQIKAPSYSPAEQMLHPPPSVKQMSQTKCNTTFKVQHDVDIKKDTCSLKAPNLIPYYQQNIGEIPVRNRSISPAPHPIRAPSCEPKVIPSPKNYSTSSISGVPIHSYRHSPTHTFKSIQTQTEIPQIKQIKEVIKESISENTKRSSKEEKEVHKSVTKISQGVVRPASPSTWNAKVEKTVQNLSPITVRIPSPIPKPLGHTHESVGSNIHITHHRDHTSTVSVTPIPDENNNMEDTKGKPWSKSSTPTFFKESPLVKTSNKVGASTGKHVSYNLNNNVSSSGKQVAFLTQQSKPLTTKATTQVNVQKINAAQGQKTYQEEKTTSVMTKQMHDERYLVNKTSSQASPEGHSTAISNISKSSALCEKDVRAFPTATSCPKSCMSQKGSSTCSPSSTWVNTVSGEKNITSIHSENKGILSSIKPSCHSESVVSSLSQQSYAKEKHVTGDSKTVKKTVVSNDSKSDGSGRFPSQSLLSLGGSSSGGNGTGGGAGGKGSMAGTTAPRRGRGVLNPNTGPQARIPLCGHCNKQIRGPFITALGKIWCPEHFICVNAQCHRPLQDIGFVEEQEGLYCEFCFEKYLAPNCSKCNIKIKGDCLNAIGKQFHPECFCCTYCGKMFGNNPFFLEDALPYCETDWNELFTTKCFACGFPIEAGDRWVEALSNNYHSQCFNCTMCKKNLEGQSFFAKGGRPFCKNHAR